MCEYIRDVGAIAHRTDSACPRYGNVTEIPWEKVVVGYFETKNEPNLIYMCHLRKAVDRQ